MEGPESRGQKEEWTSKITLKKYLYGTYLITDKTGKDLLIQSDWDFPSIASTFGWCPCECGATNGTVDCEHRTASEMICEAGDFLDEHVGETVEDPGYFH